MSFWQEVGVGLKTGLKNAVEVQRGRSFVRQWMNFKTERACRQIDAVGYEIVAAQNGALLMGIVEEFGDQIKNADEADLQQDLSDLLWYFKVQVSRRFESSGAAVAER